MNSRSEGGSTVTCYAAYPDKKERVLIKYEVCYIVIEARNKRGVLTLLVGQMYDFGRKEIATRPSTAAINTYFWIC